MAETVKLSRLRPVPYTVFYDNGTKKIKYSWAGCKVGAKPHTVQVPLEVFEYLNLSTSCISNGSLVIAQEEPKKEELISEIVEIEEAQNNTHTREEIEAILKGNLNAMKKKLIAITSEQEKIFVSQVKNDLMESEGLNSNKIKFIDDWFKNELDKKED